MRFLAISVIYLLSWSVFAQEDESLSRHNFFYGQSHSLIPWSELRPNDWLDLNKWKDQSALKDSEPRWRQNLRERGLIERVGYGLECVGTCRVIRDEGAAKLSFRSSLLEGDELVTDADSYAWIFLLDGTMVRISPETSVTFKEINISAQTIFHHARLNYGHALWLSRQEQTFSENNLKETDALFLPLDYFDANWFVPTPQIDNSKYYVDVPEARPVLKQYQRLNKLITENNEWAKGKQSVLFLVMTNATILVHAPMLEAIALPGNASFIKNRASKEMGIESERETSAYAYLRGFDNTAQEVLETAQWYQVDARGRDLSPATNGQDFSVAEYLTMRIPTINVARELMLKNYSPFVFDQSLDQNSLALEHGYRMWHGDIESGEIKQRFDFILEYARRLETTLMVEMDKYNRLLQERDEPVKTYEWSNRYYLRAIDAYALEDGQQGVKTIQGEVLNSTTNPLWKIMHAKKNL